MKTLLYVGVLCICTAIFTVATRAADGPPPTAGAERGSAKSKPVPFHGKISALDPKARTITVGKRLFHTTAETKFIKAGKSAAFEDAQVGDEIGGQYRPTAEGKLEAASIRIGPKSPEGAKNAAGSDQTKGPARQ